MFPIRFYYIPVFFSKIHSLFVWNIPSKKNKVVYLTFDDGPTSDTTEWILKTLEEYNAKATFFCVGNNVENNPELFKMIGDRGHSVGNHTHTHRDLLKTRLKNYLEDIDKAAIHIKSKLFRPPYGKITYWAARKLFAKGFKIVLWSVLSYDFDKTLSSETVLQKTIKHTKPGSIVVFHDNIKSFATLQQVLPAYLNHFKNRDFLFEAIPA
jgi:peptidoglycan/xylan/chitin deacetylase (PgdA/CDA1 family)